MFFIEKVTRVNRDFIFKISIIRKQIYRKKKFNLRFELDDGHVYERYKSAFCNARRNLSRSLPRLVYICTLIKNKEIVLKGNFNYKKCICIEIFLKVLIPPTFKTAMKKILNFQKNGE